MKTVKMINDIDGLIILDKPKDFTSNDCLSVIKRTIHPKKIGHTGTLDENATGVLVCLLGNATKSQEYLMSDGKKIYEAELIVGFSTDTEDITGDIVVTSNQIIDKIEKTIGGDANIDEYKKSDHQDMTELLELRDNIKKVLPSFLGEYEQIPPMYSAKKVDGKRMYSLARKGKIIDRKPCKVQIDSIELLNASLMPYTIGGRDVNVYKYNLRIECSKGTYIRTLCKDIGDAINVPSCMGNLRRIKNGIFGIENSITLDNLKVKVSQNDLSFIKPCYYVKDFTAITFGKFETLHLGHQKIINTVVDEAKASNLKSVAMIVGDNDDNEILSKVQRISKLKYLGVDTIIEFKLTDYNKKITSTDFIREILYKQLKAKVIVVGSDARFGYMGSGDVDLLRNECEKIGIKLYVIDKLKVSDTDKDISSTYVKEEYSKGNIDLVNKLLGKD